MINIHCVNLRFMQNTDLYFMYGNYTIFEIQPVTVPAVLNKYKSRHQTRRRDTRKLREKRLLVAWWGNFG
jgi:hypothetical protein